MYNNPTDPDQSSGSVRPPRVAREWRRKGLNSLNPRPGMAGAPRSDEGDRGPRPGRPVPVGRPSPVADALRVEKLHNLAPNALKNQGGRHTLQTMGSPP